MRYIKRYSKFFEDGGTACASASSSAGMGAVSSASPGAVAGTTGTTGSGDIGFVLGYDPKKKRKKGNPSQVSDLRDLKEVETEKADGSIEIKESVEEGREEHEDIKWALIDFVDQGFDLRIKKYDDPEEIQEMTIAMNVYLPADEDLITGNNEIKGSIEDGNIGDLKVKTIFNPTELLRSVSSLNGKDREWTESLESACLRLIDLEGYDHASFRIDKTRIPSSENVSVNIHIHMMKDPE